MARILVVDDEKMVRNVVASTLRKEGHRVSEAANGREAAEEFQIDPPDLIITDILMPESDGLDMMMTLRAQSTVPPVIAMTGLSAHSQLYLDIAQSLGAQRTLAKP